MSQHFRTSYLFVTVQRLVQSAEGLVGRSQITERPTLARRTGRFFRQLQVQLVVVECLGVLAHLLVDVRPAHAGPVLQPAGNVQVSVVQFQRRVVVAEQLVDDAQIKTLR